MSREDAGSVMAQSAGDPAGHPDGFAVPPEWAGRAEARRWFVEAREAQLSVRRHVMEEIEAANREPRLEPLRAEQLKVLCFECAALRGEHDRPCAIRGPECEAGTCRSIDYPE